ncbi:C40 family peptidase [Patiriisocius hiemis]|uniref:C40 family peptidase n=1 Tax=Patiriisocius hiemis TaxID=3075604 RepID=A0ABU2YDJ9_9FLAO|nr:C40 family peptidase [Constantimarinum sp. W242]MDT0556261.1 C40 family peptidase [Constantimarinum sp. W242]
MKKTFLLIFLGLLLTSCGSKKKVVAKKYPVTTKITKSSNKSTLESVIDHAISYKGTRYKFGGTTSKGMDCSGLVYTAFKEESVLLPRVSRDMAKKGKQIKLREATKGDLVFFQTNKNRKVINHVGLVVETKNGIQFIHATTSRGVIISSLDEKYWKNAFVEIRRII